MTRSRGMKKKGTNVLLYKEQDVAPKAKLHLRRSKQKVSMMKMRYIEQFFTSNNFCDMA